MFVCHGNICRSTMAEYVFLHLVEQQGRSHEFHVGSSGTSREEIGNDVHHGTRRKLNKEGIHVGHRSAKQLTLSDYREFDHIVAMDEMNLRNIDRIIGSDTEGKVSLLLEFAGIHRDIADPWYTGNFDVTFNDVMQGCQALLDSIEKR